MSQSWEDFEDWEKFFENHPIKTLIELGTGVGGMSLYFGLQCKQRGITFHTFDNQKFMDFERGLSGLLNLQGCFHFMDMFSVDTQYYLAGLIEKAEHPLAIFFDNGDKPWEWRLYAPYTSVGDFCVVHDWGTEFKESDIVSVKVKPIFGDTKNTAAMRTIWFERI